jgi:hypothetical protein
MSFHFAVLPVSVAAPPTPWLSLVIRKWIKKAQSIRALGLVAPSVGV